MEQTIPRPEFPRPDFVRNEWEILNGTWEFSFEEPVFDRQIQVPFCYQSSMSGIGETKDCKTVWYRRTVELKEEKLAGQNIYELTLIIDGVLPKEYEKKLEQLCERAAEGLMADFRAGLMELAGEIGSSAPHNVTSDSSVIQNNTAITMTSPKINLESDKYPQKS